VLETPVTGGNVSFYNSTAGTPINPTPVVGVLGLIDDVARRTPMGFAGAGDVVLLLGDTRDELGGSEWAWSQHQHLGGRPPQVDLAREQALGRVLIAGSRDGLLTSAHDLSDGGLGQALVESALSKGIGVEIALPAGLSAFIQLFSESAGRALVSVSPEQEQAFIELCAAQSVPVTRLGATGGDALAIDGVLTAALDELGEAFEGTLPRLFG
jgi:phosphoribosylformylglycinamidine synthase